MLTLLAPGKLNLTLEVLGKRPDGYHEIRSLVQTIKLYDTLSFEQADIITLDCTEPTLQNQENLVIHAAELLRKAYSYNGGAKIKLKKEIPWGAGLGGGSSDAAATLLALNELWGLKLTMPELGKLGATLSSDVPLFIHKGTVLLEGRGEKVTSLPSISPHWFVLVFPQLPKIAGKTKQAYMSLKKSNFTKGQFTTRVIEAWAESGKINPMLLFNVFDSIAFDVFPGLNVYWKRLDQAGVTNIHLAGSGTTLFTLANDENSAIELHQRIEGQGIISNIVSSISDEGIWRR